ncbi:MAG: ABC transporter permease [archaeon]|nr:ABC transporter permease [archaeon]
MLSEKEPDQDSSAAEYSSRSSSLLQGGARERLRATLQAIWSNKGALIGAIIVSVFVITSLVVGIANTLHITITPYNPIQQNTGPALAPPSWAHLMGTDQLGEDVFSRIVAATPNDFAVSLAVIAFALIVGALLGTYAAFHGGLVDEALMRITDIFFAIPVLVLAMAIGVALGVGIVHMTIALMLVWWPPYARLARGEALKIAHQNYIDAARLSAAGRFRIILKHALPNITMTLIVYASLDIGTVIIIYAGLSYLGLAVTPPQPDWGQMVSAYRDFILSAPWLPLFPGLVIALGVIGFSLLGDGLRDTLEAF